MSKYRALIAGHGDFAAGIVSAAVQITGRDDVFASLSNRGLSAADVAAAMGRLLDESGARVVFTDLPAGSCTIAARRILRDDPTVTLVTGAALPTVLSFACGGDPVRAVEQGHAALTIVEGKRDA